MIANDSGEEPDVGVIAEVGTRLVDGLDQRSRRLYRPKEFQAVSVIGALALVNDFYDQLSPFYHLIYRDWEADVAQQARSLGDIMESRWGRGAKSVLDVSCGIGTQSLGLAALGFQVTGSDLSREAVARARKEASSCGLTISFSVCDMREAAAHHGRSFDLVLSGDNSVPHLLNDEDILLALRAMHACLRPGGGCVITVRDYDREERGKGIVKPYGIREENGKRYLIWQIWDFEGEQYDLTMYFVEDDKASATAITRIFRHRYYAIGTSHLIALMQCAGFSAVERLDDVFIHPVLVGTRT